MAIVKLIDCLGKAQRLPIEAKEALMARAESYVGQGVEEIAASKRAVNDHLGIVREDMAKVQDAMRSPVANSEHPTIDTGGHSRARKGGEYGANGEWYEGGKFIATTDHPKGMPVQHKRTGRVQIESGVWVDRQEGKLPLFPMLAGIERFDRSANTFSFEPDLRLYYATPEAIKDRKAKIAAYNAGDRWVNKSPTHPTIDTTGEGNLFKESALPFNLQGQVDTAPIRQAAIDAKNTEAERQKAAEQAQDTLFARRKLTEYERQPTETRPPERPAIEDFEQEGLTKGEVWERYKAGIEQWNHDFKAWVDQQGDSGIFLSEPEELTKPRHTITATKEGAKVVTKNIGESEGKYPWRVTTFDRYTGPDAKDGQFPGANEWAPWGHTVHATKEEAFREASYDYKPQKFSSNALFARQKPDQQDLPLTVADGMAGATKDEAALFHRNVGYAYRLADSYYNMNERVAQDDRRQEALIALTLAVRRYNPERGEFLPFAGMVIRNHLRALYGKAIRTVPTEHIGAPVGDSEATLGDMLPDASAPMASDTAERNESVQILRSIIDAMPPAEKEVVMRRMGGESQEEIANTKGVSKQRISNIERAAMGRMRARLEARGVKELPRALYARLPASEPDTIIHPALPENATRAAKPTESKAMPIGIVASPQVANAMGGLRAVGSSLMDTTTKLPKDSDFHRHLLNWVANNQANTDEIMKLSDRLTQAVPDAVKRDGITNYIQAGGNLALLAKRSAMSKNLQYRRGYEAAQHLTPEEKAVARTIQDTYADLRQRALKYNIDVGHVANYATQLWDTGNPEMSATSGKRLSDYFRFQKPRTFRSFFDGEQAGYKPKTKDIAKLLSTYANNLNNSINARQFVESLGKGVASDGRPLLDPRGSVVSTDKEEGGKAYLVMPQTRGEEAKDYEILERTPALRDWLWKSQDAEGNPIMMNADLAIHPEIRDHLKNVLGKSALRDWWDSTSSNPLQQISKSTAKFLLDDLQHIGKATMFGMLSPFHQVQEGTHAIGHRVNPFSVPKIDLTNPEQMDAAQHGLMLRADRLSQQYFMDGVGADNKNLVTRTLRALGPLRVLGPLGERAASVMDAYQSHLFQTYIPGLKFATYQHILKRNTGRFKGELQSGEVSIDQVKDLSARQANVAYGHLNYADMGRNPTMQHIFQMAALAPDFLESRARFAGQAMKGIASKTGVEQFQALAFLAATQWILARIVNQLANDDPDWDHPFEIRLGNRYYGLRSVPGDMFNLWKDPVRFAHNRVSPIFGKGVIEGMSHTNWRGEKTDAMGTLKDIVFGVIPLGAQPLTNQFTDTGRNASVSAMEQFMGTIAIHIHRFSPITEIYPLAREWQKKNAPETIKDAVYPVSKYQQLRYALEDSDQEKARSEAAKLSAAGMADVEKGFKLSVNHPFTGSIENDKKFALSLDAEGQRKFNAAVARRAVILNRFHEWVSPETPPKNHHKVHHKELVAQ